MRTFCVFMVVGLSLQLPAAVAAEPRLEELIAELTGPDELARARARQLLPRQGLGAAEAVLPYLTDADPATAKAAFDILFDIANRFWAPGRDPECRRMADLLMPLVGRGRTEQERVLGLRLLERTVPPGYDLGPIAALLGEEGILRDKARAALERIGTPEAAAALRRNFRRSDPEFQRAMLNSLATMEAEGSLADIAGWTKSPHPGVRAAAVRALAWTGNPKYLDTARGVVREADEATKAEATDALIRLLNAMETKAKHRKVVREAYGELLQSTEGAFRDAALAGLVRIGEATGEVALLAKGSGAGDGATSDVQAHARAAALAGVIVRWRLLGPFELGEKEEGWREELIGEPKVRPDEPVRVGDTVLHWRAVDASKSRGRLNLRREIANRDRCIGYAYAGVVVDGATEAELRIGADDSEQVWVNGEKVFELFTPRALTPDADRIPVRLRAGANSILLKIWQNNQAWEFRARLTRPDGSPLPFSQTTDEAD